LRRVLGKHVYQKGSNITAERLRLDFPHPSKMTDEEIAKVERLVNQAIKDDLPVSWSEMTVAEAKEKGATGVFEERYGDRVKVYQIGREGEVPFSVEICGGPHVARTGALGTFSITKEEAVSAGVRRVRATVA
ncbi:MAG: alanine--tRNA ligase, partial [Candidatus Wildermuthbacteria bacterium]|nr:alanine--tRNA ligase [Candidatus Wildermuthbacteria bacterium]